MNKREANKLIFEECRKALGLNTEKLAKALGISKRAIYHYRAGDRSVPVPVLKLVSMFVAYEEMRDPFSSYRQISRE